jgi:hypothetical protein
VDDDEAAEEAAAAAVAENEDDKMILTHIAYALASGYPSSRNQKRAISEIENGAPWSEPFSKKTKRLLQFMNLGEKW